MVEYEIVKNILNEINKLSYFKKIKFNVYFEKYGVKEEDKLAYYHTIMEQLRGWISLPKKYANAVVGLPYNLPHKRNRKYKQDTTVDKEKIMNVVKVIEDGNGYSVTPSQENKDGTMTMGYTSYDESVNKLFRFFPFFEGDYHKNIKTIMNKEISKLKIKEIRQYVTYIFRKERFIDGHISQYIDNGILASLLRRFIEISK